VAPGVEDRLEAQLDAATRRWIGDPGKGLRIDREANAVRLSRIFDWFAGDFERAGGALAFAARYASEPDRSWLVANGPRARVAYLDYDWAVNALAPAR
jgi:hypothetical protein